MAETTNEVYAPHLTPQPGEWWLYRDGDPLNDSDVLIMPPYRRFLPYIAVDMMKGRREPWWVDRQRLRPKPGEPYCTPPPLETALVRAQHGDGSQYGPNPNGRYPLCRPGIGPARSRTCEVCGEPIATSGRPCPAIPANLRWGPDAEVVTPEDTIEVEIPDPAEPPDAEPFRMLAPSPVVGPVEGKPEGFPIGSLVTRYQHEPGIVWRVTSEAFLSSVGSQVVLFQELADTTRPWLTIQAFVSSLTPYVPPAENAPVPPGSPDGPTPAAAPDEANDALVVLLAEQLTALLRSQRDQYRADLVEAIRAERASLASIEAAHRLRARLFPVAVVLVVLFAGLLILLDRSRPPIPPPAATPSTSPQAAP